MSRCPYLDYEGHSFFGNSDDEYICKLTGRHFDVNSPVVKYTCKGDNDAYYDCQIYKNS